MSTRWYVRPEPAPTRFGESNKIRWAVYPYNERDRNREPKLLGAGTYFRRRSAALRYAINSARRARGGGRR